MMKRRGSSTGGRSGQTMLEAIVASGIIITAVGAALTLVHSSIAGAKESDNRLIATNLAREGVEVIRMLRDSNWLAGREWDDGLEGGGSDYSGIVVFDAATKTWSVDFAPDALEDEDAVIYRQVVAGGPERPGLFRQGIPQPDGTDTTFFRRIVHVAALCANPVGSTSNFIAYDVMADGAACATEKIGAEIRSEVGWTSGGGGEHTVNAVERIFDWR